MEFRKLNCGIYQIKNLVNGLCYIGQTHNLRKRFKKHKSMLKQGKHYNKNLQDDFTTYGIENFAFEILEICDEQVLDTKEQEWIKNLGGVDSGKVYNIQTGGLIGIDYSKEYKEKISKKCKENHYGLETEFKKGCIPWNKGKHPTNQTLQRLRESHLGFKVNEETKKKLSQINKGKRLGKERYNSIPVLKIDTNGNIVKRYECLQEASREVGINGINIKKRALHSDRLYDNYYWKLERGQ